MTGRVKLKGKHKRGERGSVDEEQQILKRANMADEEEVCSTKDKEAPTGGNEEDARPRTNIEDTSLSELKEMLVDIQIMVSHILRQNSKLTNEVAELRIAFQQQKSELTAVKTTLAKMMKRQDDFETELVAARIKISEQEEEIAELYDLLRSGTMHKEKLTGNPWSPRICIYFNRGGCPKASRGHKRRC